MAKLYEILPEYLALLDEVEAGADEYRPTLEALHGALEQKVENIALVVKQLEAEAEAIKVEAEKLDARRKAKVSKIAWLKTNLLAPALRALNNESKFESARVTAKLTLGRGSVEVIEELAIPDKYWVQKRELNKSALNAALSDGATINGAHLVKKENVVVK